VSTLATKLIYTETVIRNLTSAEKFFGFLPKHGKRLKAFGDANKKDYFTFEGTLATMLQDRKRYIDAYKRAAGTKDLISVRENRRHVVYADVLNATVIAVGDLCYWDTGSSSVKPASSFTWGGSLAATQASFNDVFLGVALEAHANGGGAVKIAVDISPDSLHDFAATSATHQIGDLVGPAKDVGNNLLANKVEAAVAANAIGRVRRRDSGATATALIAVHSAFYGHNTNAVLG
jgi:hypothetical protein